MEKELKPCEFCGNEIRKEPNRNWNEYSKKRFCSRICSSKKQSKKVSCRCNNCGNTFLRSGSHQHKNKYCSPKCRHEHKTETRACEICGTIRTKPKSIIHDHFYCGMRCQGIAKRKNTPNNQGRRSPN